MRVSQVVMDVRVIWDSVWWLLHLERNQVEDKMDNLTESSLVD